MTVDPHDLGTRVGAWTLDLHDLSRERTRGRPGRLFACACTRVMRVPRLCSAQPAAPGDGAGRRG